MTQPEFVLRHKWEPNDIVIWDNISTAHYAVNDYGSCERKLRRVTVEGDKPFGYNGLKSRITQDPLEIEG
jgi:taurine dioxygenase